MTTPTVATTNSGVLPFQTSPHSINLPASIAAGDLLIVFFACDSGATATTPAGWTLMSGAPTVYSPGWRLYGFSRVASGSEGATLSIATSASATCAYTCYRITGAAPVVPVFAAATGSSTAPNPPSLTPGGTADWLWIAVQANAGATKTGDPTGYSNPLTGGSSSNNTAISSAQKATTGTSTEDPAAFTIGTSPWAAWTVGVTPTVPPSAITGVGAIASAEAFGTAVVTPHYALSGIGAIASAEAFGTTAVVYAQGLTGIGAIASAEAFGTTAVTPVYALSGIGGISSAEAFGTARVTGHDPAPAELHVYIDWDGDGVFDAGDEVTGDLRARSSVEWGRGRSADFSTDATGAASFTLKNIGATLDAPGPYAPNPDLLPGKPVLIKSSYALVEKAHFFGFIQRVTPNASDFSVTITCYDPLQRASEVDVVVPPGHVGRTCREMRLAVLAELDRGHLNMVPNPSFETDLSTWGNVYGTYARVTTEHYSGAACMRMTDTGGGARAYALAPGMLAPATYAGQVYTGSIYLKAPAGTTVYVQLGMGWSLTPWEVTSTVEVTDTWKRFSLCYVPSVTRAPAFDVTNSGFLTFGVKMITPGSVVYLDAAAITRGPELWPYADSGTGFWPNWMPNGTFEGDASYWNDDGAGRALLNVTTDQVHTGLQSLQVDTNGSGGGPGGVHGDLYSAQSMFAQGSSYTASVWVYSVTDLPYSCSLVGGTDIATVTGTVPGGAWTKVSVTLTPTSTWYASAPGDLVLAFRQTDGIARRWYMDDAWLTPGVATVEALPQWDDLPAEDDFYMVDATFTGSALSALKTLNDLSLSHHYIRATLTAPYYEYVVSTRDQIPLKTVAETFDNSFHGFTAADIDRDSITNVVKASYQGGDIWYSDEVSLALYGSRPGKEINGAAFFPSRDVPDLLAAAVLARYSNPRSRPSMERVNKSVVAQASILDRELDDLIQLNLDRLGIAGKKYLIVNARTRVKGKLWTATWGLEEHAF